MAPHQAGEPNAEPEAKTPPRRFRHLVTALLVGVSCILVVLSTNVVWAHATILNTNVFVNTVGPIFENPSVDSAVATRATAQLFTALDLQTRLKDALPPRVSFAATPITNSTKGFVAAQLTKVLASPQFQTVWTAMLRKTHEELVAVLRGQSTKAVSTANGYIVINTVPALNQALGGVAGLASNLTGKQVKLPTITTVEVPQQAINKLSDALGVQLPRSFGQVTLVKSSDLAVVQRGVRAFDRLTIAMPLITLAIIAVCLWLSLARRRTLIQLTVGIALLMIVERRIVIHAQSTLASKAHDPQAAQDVLGQLLHGFFVLTAWVVAIPLIVLVIALLTGPYRWAVGLRSFVVRSWDRAIEKNGSERRGRFVVWMASHASGLQLAGAVVAGMLLLVVSVSWISFLIVGVLLAAFEILLQRLKPPELTESASSEAGGPESRPTASPQH